LSISRYFPDSLGAPSIHSLPCFFNRAAYGALLNFDHVAGSEGWSPLKHFPPQTQSPGRNNPPPPPKVFFCFSPAGMQTLVFRPTDLLVNALSFARIAYSPQPASRTAISVPWSRPPPTEPRPVKRGLKGISESPSPLPNKRDHLLFKRGPFRNPRRSLS